MSEPMKFTLDLAKDQDVQEYIQNQVQDAILKYAFDLSQAKEQETFDSSIDLEVDADLIARFVYFAYGYSNGGTIAFRSFTERGGSDSKPVLAWVENNEHAPARLTELAQQAANERRSAYVIPSTMPNGLAKASDAIGQSIVVCDIDSGDINAKLKHISNALGKPSVVIASGGLSGEQSKLHCYWKLTEEASGDDLKALGTLQHRIAICGGTDTAFQSIHQPLRIPGSWHCKSDPKPVSVVAWNEGLEYELHDLINLSSDMTMFGGGETPFDLSNAKDQKTPIDDLMVQKVRAEGVDGTTRFEAISRVIGYELTRFWNGQITLETAWDEVVGFNLVNVVPSWPEDRLREEFHRLYNKREKEHGASRVYVEEHNPTLLDGFNFGELHNSTEQIPEDLIDGILEAEGQLLIAGAPKSQKSMMVQWILERGALGLPVWGKKVARPLKIAYIQAEMTKWQLLSRFKMRNYTPEQIAILDRNLWVSSKFMFPLDKDGLDLVIRTIRTRFPDGPDVVVFDPFVNLLPDDTPENDNGKIMTFIRKAIERVRTECNPKCAEILIHHTAKKKYEDLIEDPFSVIRGASSLRGWYTQGMVIARIKHDKPERAIFFENRSKVELATMTVCLDPMTKEFLDTGNGGKIIEPERPEMELISIESILIEKSHNKEYFTRSSLAEKHARETFAKSDRYLRDEITRKLKEGELKLFDGRKQGLDLKRKDQLYLWCPGVIDTIEEQIDEFGEIKSIYREVEYTHWMNRDGVVLPKEG